MKKTGVIGLGLIGGSFALALKRAFPDMMLFGTDKFYLDKAVEIGLVEQELTDELLSEMDLIIIATPVDTIGQIADTVLHKIKSSCLVMDAGSTKSKIAQQVANHPKRKNFLLAHPIAGTEYSGPEAAFGSLYKNKMNIVCDVVQTDKKLLAKAYEIFKTLKMKTVEMDSGEHDKHIAYVSHLSHISSFMLGKTVMDLEKDEKNIFQMAGSGFASTVRLAKSSPDTWTPIFLENKEPILKALDEYVDNLNDFKVMLYRENSQRLKNSLQKINRIKEIIDRI